MLKKFIQSALLLVVLCTTATTYAQVSQVPDGIQFQALATDANGHPAAGRVIYVKDAIVVKTATGTIVYSETFKVTASSAGIFTIVLGKGTYASGVSSIANIDWANGPFFLNLKIAVEPTIPNAGWNANNEYVDLGTSQFWSVPYALYAGNVKGADGKLNTSDTAAMLKPYFTSINLKANIESPTFTGTVSGITKAMVGLGNVDNTADLNKPISIATQAALDLKANATDVATALALKANTADVTTALALKANTADVNTALDLKVDKVTGKALSTNDYTTAEKTKLAAITGTNTGDQDLSALATNTALALKANTTDVNTSLNLKANATDVAASLATKVDKVTGKDLSTNDFTTAEKTKLAAITGTNTGDQDLSALATNTALALKANTADVNNSLALKANVSSLSTVATSGSYNDLSNKPTIPSAYTLPTASASVLGGVKVGSNLSIDASGVLSANVNAGSVSGTVTVANGGTGATTLTGLVKGNGTNALTEAIAGTDYQAPLTLTTIGTGAATFSGTTLTIPTYSLPIADGINLGGVKVGSNLNVDVDGVLTANINAGTLTGTTLAANVVNSSLTSVGTITSGIISLTTDIATTGNLKAGAVTYPNTHGTNGQVLSTTGTGTLSWTSIPAPDLTNYVTTNTAQTITASKTFSSSATATNNLALGTIFSPTLTAAANTDILVGVDINPTFTNGAFTPVANYGLRVQGIHIGRGGGNQNFNLAVGSSALFRNTVGNTNVAIGNNSLTFNTVGNNNTAIGNNTLTTNTVGNFNTAIGNSANVASNNLTNATALGYGARVSASNTIQLGADGTFGTVAISNVKTSGTLTAGTVTYPNAHNNANGQVLTINSTGTASWAAAAGVPYTGATGAVNLGAYNLTVNGITVGIGGGGNGTQNTAIGQNALSDNDTTGYDNTANGYYALSSNTEGDGNTAGGHGALSSNTVGSGNTASGHSSLLSNIIGNNNTAIGGGSLNANTVGKGNTANGYLALNNNTMGNNNTAIGTLADVASNNLTNATAIGYGAQVSASNTIQLGADGSTTDYDGGNIIPAVTNVKTSGAITAGGKIIAGASSASSTSAVMEANSTTQGFLPPRLTTTQRDAIASPAEGLTLWNTTNKQLEVYDGSYWKNMVGLLVSPLEVGDEYGGGKVFYIFGPSDNGYIKGQTHGLIAALEDQTTDAGVKWFPDKFYGATGTYIGLGLPNTLAIITSAIVTGTTNMSSFAAGLANSYRGGGNIDWFLPSKDELNLLYQAKEKIGGFATNQTPGASPAYWSSTQKGGIVFTNFTSFANGVTSARLQFFNTGGSPVQQAGTITDTGIDNPRRVRAIRIF